MLLTKICVLSGGFKNGFTFHCPSIFLAYFWQPRWCVMFIRWRGGFTKIYLRFSVGIDLFMCNFRFIHEPYHKLRRLIDLFITIMRFQENPLVELKAEIQSSYILRRPKKFTKSSPYFWLALHRGWGEKSTLGQISK